MITLVYGGTSSGKSAYAEDLVCSSKYQYRFYLATMSANDEESKSRIQRHRKLREGKGFITLEHARDIRNSIGDIERICTGNFSTEDLNANGRIVLLECMSNLVANEMFCDGEIYDAGHCIEKIIDEIKELESQVSELVIVTNNVFEDGITYDTETEDYLKALGTINSKLAK